MTAAALLIVVLFAALPESRFGSAFLPNVATEVLGIVITLAIVQRYLDRRDRAELLVRTAAARDMLRRACLVTQEALADVVVTADEVRGEATVAELLKRRSREEGFALELSRKLPAFKGDRREAQAFADEARELLGRLLAHYSHSLPASLVAALEDMLGDQLLRSIASGELFESPQEVRDALEEEWGHIGYFILARSLSSSLNRILTSSDVYLRSIGEMGIDSLLVGDATVDEQSRPSLPSNDGVQNLGSGSGEE